MADGNTGIVEYMNHTNEKKGISESIIRRVPALRFPEFTWGTAGVSLGGPARNTSRNDVGRASRVRDAATVSLEWEEKRFGEIANFFSGGTPLTSKPEYYNGDLPFIKSGEIDAEVTAQNITESALKDSSAKKVKRGDLLYALYGATSGQAALSKVDGAINQAVLCIRSRHNNSFFLYSILKREKERILSKYLQGGQGNLSADIVKSLRIFLPERIEEQEKIAGFLGAVDEWIGNLREERSALETYKRGIMQRLFSSPPARGGVASLRVEGVGDLRFRDDAGNDFPEWEEKQFGNVFSFRKTNSLSRELLNYESGEVKNIHYGDIHTKFSNTFDIEKEDVPYINSEVGFEVSDEADYLHEGDLVIADASEDYKDVGKSLEISNLDTQKVVAGLHTVVARALVGKVARGFSGYLMKARNVRLQIMRLAVGISVLGISKRNLSEMRIQLPSIDEQQKIADFLTALDEVITTKADEITRAEEWKKGLMQKMFV
jgi:type I restriction enzyme, S subunit